MHGPINVRSPHNISKWQMGFNLAFKGLISHNRAPCSTLSSYLLTLMPYTSILYLLIHSCSYVFRRLFLTPSSGIRQQKCSFFTIYKIFMHTVRHFAKSWKVAGSISDGVSEVFCWHNVSGRTMFPESNQPLTEMSTRNIFCGVNAAGT
jgi:hypothetical protein